MVVVAQTKISFLTGGRGQRFRGLPEEERHTQEEEIYARAAVALTRARKMCVIFCPLDIKGLIGAATVMGSLMYGAEHCWHGTISMHLRGSSLEDCPGDDQFLSSLDHNDVPCGSSVTPVVLIECVADIMQQHYKVRRLHLVIVDLWRPWKINHAQVRSLADQLRRLHYRGRLYFMGDDSCMVTALMALTFPAISCGQFAHKLVPFVCWSPGRGAVSILNMLDSYAHSESDTFMMGLACELRSAFDRLHLQRFSCRRMMCLLIWSCHGQQ